ncbi:MAG: hypothetical protein HYV35_05755 [Lentisphaerae bacterium]|nr:hypothetical protein [Lentisphaerota bacterium]
MKSTGMMTSRERLLSAIRHERPDHVPLYAWVFGFPAPPGREWSRQGQPRAFWYTGRLEHIHTLPQPWDVEDDFQRVDAWLALGLDDVLEISVPWSHDTKVTFQDSRQPAGQPGNVYPVLTREYQTPGGRVRHSVNQTGEEYQPGWVVQPDHVPLIEDINIPRAAKHLVAEPDEVQLIPWLYQGPNAAQKQWLAKRLEQVGAFAKKRGVMVQAWAAFGMDAAVWFCGAEGAVMLCLDHPKEFDALLTAIQNADKARVAAALEHPAVDLICMRGWYSSTDFWSPAIFRTYLKPRIAELAALAHAKNRLFAYTMTVGVMELGAELIEAGVDLLYGVDPVQAHVNLAEAHQKFGGRLAIAGGLNSSITLGKGTAKEIRAAIQTALTVYGRDGGFILLPVDALFPDTPWASVQTMIAAWKEYR